MAGRIKKPSAPKSKLLTIEMVPVESSTVKAIGHHAEHRVLRVAFKSGFTYDYAKVSREKYDTLRAADSIGGHLHEHIKLAVDAKGRPAHSHKKLDLA
jgi:hypothetical protein